MSQFDRVSTEEQLSIIIDTLRLYSKRVYDLDISPDFVPLSLCGIKHLERAGRVNVTRIGQGIGYHAA